MSTRRNGRSLRRTGSRAYPLRDADAVLSLHKGGGSARELRRHSI